MSKAILILDKMPESCMECKLGLMYGTFCAINGDTYVTEGNKSEECPLKPIPSREDIHEEIYQAYGLGKEERYERMRDAVDKVLDEILGEDNEKGGNKED